MQQTDVHTAKMEDVEQGGDHHPPDGHDETQHRVDQEEQVGQEEQAVSAEQGIKQQLDTSGHTQWNSAARRSSEKFLKFSFPPLYQYLFNSILSSIDIFFLYGFSSFIEIGIIIVSLFKAFSV